VILVKEMQQDKLQEILNGMRQFDEAGDHYAFTFTANNNDLFTFSTQTHWEGWADEKCTKEIRAPSLVKPEKMAYIWQIQKQPYLVVNKDDEYFLYCFLGGNALVNANVAQRMASHLLKPHVSVRSGDLGFINIKNLPKQAFNRAPTPKQRMQILKRDAYRCCICGRRAADYTDVELHIHHIRPFGDGGLTEDGNLITLCHTCHKGLDPHGDSQIFTLVSAKNNTDDERADFFLKVIQYRELYWNAYMNLNKKGESKNTPSKTK
jgi:hypothetical protein